MGQTAENLARLKGVTRQDMDEFGVRSQNLAEKAINERLLGAGDHPGHHPGRHASSPRTTARAPASPWRASQGLKPVFRPDGLVTAGNCCPLNDGAAALVIMSDTKARELGLTPLARDRLHRRLRPLPRDHGLRARSRPASRRWRRAGMTIDDIDLVEINEAFAAQVIPSYRDLGIDLDKLNVNGGAIAVGHPFGMTGARITATLHQLPSVPRQAVRPGDHVRRRRPGHGDGHRAAELTTATRPATRPISRSPREPSAPGM